MTKLQTTANQYIEQIQPGILRIKPISCDEIINFEKTIIDTKIEQINQELSLQSLALVRIMSSEDFPTTLEYHSLHSDGKTTTFDNPFHEMFSYIKYIEEFKDINIGCNHSEIEPSQLRIEYPLHRKTKHFSLNGLVSNVTSIHGPIQVLNDKNIIAIEPFAEHINDSLVNLNPVDTFYDVDRQPFKIGNNAVFIIDDNTYKELIRNSQKKEDLSRVTVILYQPQDIEPPKYSNVNMQTAITDIVLSYLGYIPQHSVNQSELKEEYYFNEKGIVSDKQYIKRFQEYMDILSVKLLNQSYFYITADQLARRRNYNDSILDLPGTLHADTEYGVQERKTNITTVIKTLRKYLDFLVENYGLDPELSEKIFISYSKNIKEYYGKAFVCSYYPIECEGEALSYLEEIGYKNLVTATQYFNKISKTDKQVFTVEEETRSLQH